jgi:murein L,D-transpeptidase YcbB/YkuD
MVFFLGRPSSIFALGVFLFSPVAAGAATIRAEDVLGHKEQPSKDAPAAKANTPQEKFLASIRFGQIDGVSLGDPQGLEVFYRARDFRPFWLPGKTPAGRIQDAIDVLDKAWEHGLNPASYHMEWLRKKLKEDVWGDESSRAAFELVLSDAVARYGRDLTGMRLSPGSVGEDASSWSRGLGADKVLSRIAQQSSVKKTLSDLEPTDKLYARLKEELKKTVEAIAKDPDGDRPPIDYPGVLKLGRTHPAIAVIRSRLGVEAADGQDAALYDDALSAAVMSFQGKHGLKPDGLIGQRTFAAINQGRTDRLIKILATLERLRWMNGYQLPERYVEVNIPAMALRVVENGQTAFEMPVIIGREERQTPSFIAEVTGIRFNPSWHVPDTIKTKDFLPELQKDPAALEKKRINFIVRTEEGSKVVTPQEIDWANVTPRDLKSISMVQGPGDDNALGRIRILMPNRYDVYLHDTNSPNLFAKDYRALSSGCVRLAEPRRIANFILSPNQGWTEEKMESLLGKRRTVEIRAEKPLTIFILYRTVWEDGAGDLIIGDDVYGRDAKLINTLQSKGQVSFPINLSNFKSL